VRTHTTIPAPAGSRVKQTFRSCVCLLLLFRQ